jgi:hypothetical protein
MPVTGLVLQGYTLYSLISDFWSTNIIKHVQLATVAGTDGLDASNGTKYTFNLQRNTQQPE